MESPTSIQSLPSPEDDELALDFDDSLEYDESPDSGPDNTDYEDSGQDVQDLDDVEDGAVSNIDPDQELQFQRARLDHKLKNTFEALFEKYGKDFDGVGDEIDMYTGKIVVNNGHLASMKDEKDAGADLPGTILRGITISSEGEADPLGDYSEEELQESKQNDIVEDDLNNALIQREREERLLDNMRPYNKRLGDISESEATTRESSERGWTTEGDAQDAVLSRLKLQPLVSGGDETSLSGTEEVDGDSELPSRAPRMSSTTRSLFTPRENSGLTHASSISTGAGNALFTHSKLIAEFGSEIGPHIARYLAQQQELDKNVVEPAWRVPVFDASTPKERPLPKSYFASPDVERSPSPENGVSVWALPGSRDQRRAQTDKVIKRKWMKSRVNQTSERKHLLSSSVEKDDDLPTLVGPGMDSDSPVLPTHPVSFSSPTLHRRATRVRRPTQHASTLVSWSDAIPSVQSLDPIEHRGLIRDSRYHRIPNSRSEIPESEDESSAPVPSVATRHRRSSDHNATLHANTSQIIDVGSQFNQFQSTAAASPIPSSCRVPGTMNLKVNIPCTWSNCTRTFKRACGLASHVIWVHQQHSQNGPINKEQAPPAPFGLNEVDPAYEFSDEEELNVPILKNAKVLLTKAASQSSTKTVTLPDSDQFDNLVYESNGKLESEANSDLLSRDMYNSIQAVETYEMSSDNSGSDTPNFLRKKSTTLKTTPGPQDLSRNAFKFTNLSLPKSLVRKTGHKLIERSGVRQGNISNLLSMKSASMEASAGSQQLSKGIAELAATPISQISANSLRHEGVESTRREFAQKNTSVTATKRSFKTPSRPRLRTYSLKTRGLRGPTHGAIVDETDHNLGKSAMEKLTHYELDNEVDEISLGPDDLTILFSRPRTGTPFDLPSHFRIKNEEVNSPKMTDIPVRSKKRKLSSGSIEEIDELGDEGPAVNFTPLGITPGGERTSAGKASQIEQSVATRETAKPMHRMVPQVVIHVSLTGSKLPTPFKQTLPLAADQSPVILDTRQIATPEAPAEPTSSPVQRGPTKFSQRKGADNASSPPKKPRLATPIRNGHINGLSTPLLDFLTPRKRNPASHRCTRASGRHRVEVSSPGGTSRIFGTVNTPRGTVKKCGQDGTACGRVFCFKCGPS